MRDERKEVPILGGVTEVVRVGETIRRTMGPWSPSVHHLLRHLERQGFDGAPRALGVDEQGREVLTYLPGQVGGYPLPQPLWSMAALEAAARLLRRFHDATVSYVPPDGAVWQMADPDAGRHEVICHNDAAPHNTVYVDGLPCAFIDFDTAGPGPRVRDLAYAAYRFVPLAADAHARTLGYDRPGDVTARLCRFCDAYGFEDRASLIDAVEERLEELVAWILARSAAGDPAYRRHLAAGHADLYRADIAFLKGQRGAWATALLSGRPGNPSRLPQA